MSKLRAVLAVALWAASLGLRAEPEPTLTTTATPLPEKPSILVGGFVWGAEFEQVQLDNGRPLSYAPLQIGWEFSRGFRALGGLSVYFYQGDQVDAQNPNLGVRRYTFQVSDWRLEAQWLPLRGWLFRPILGLGIDLVGGERRLAPALIGGIDLNAAAPRENMAGYFGASASAGLESDFGGPWRLQVRSRVIAAFGASTALPLALGMGIYRVF